MRRVGVVTVGRSDYGILRPVLRALQARSDVDVALYVGGAHFSERFGRTIEEIEADGVPIAARIPSPDTDDSPLAAARSIGRLVEGFADAFDRTSPDVVVLLGDRFEMLAAGVAALPLAIPLAHVHGGESTEGLIDEAVRHALTKFSHLHFPATDEYARRIVQLGEEPWRITVSGAPALDAVRDFEPLDSEALAMRGLKLDPAPLLVTYHPITLLPDATRVELDAILGAVADSEFDAVFTYPNADPRHGQIIEKMETFVESSERYTLVRNLGQSGYFTLLGRAVAMVGNSSSGIIEAASFGLPVVDVGTRQRGRIRARNVIHAEPTRESVIASISKAASPEFRSSLEGLTNPYGDGHAGERIAERLATVPLDDRLLVKSFHDV